MAELGNRRFDLIEALGFEWCSPFGGSWLTDSFACTLLESVRNQS